MKCSKCEVEAPDNLIVLGKEWTCPNCETPKETVIDKLEQNYKSMGPSRILYVSEFTNNLFKVEQHFNENVLMDNPFCSISLTLPVGTSMLKGRYDKVYIDEKAISEEEALKLLQDHGELRWVQPTTLVLI